MLYSERVRLLYVERGRLAYSTPHGHEAKLPFVHMKFQIAHLFFLESGTSNLTVVLELKVAL